MLFPPSHSQHSNSHVETHTAFPTNYSTHCRIASLAAAAIAAGVDVIIRLLYLLTVSIVIMSPCLRSHSLSPASSDLHRDHIELARALCTFEMLNKARQAGLLVSGLGQLYLLHIRVYACRACVPICTYMYVHACMHVCMSATYTNAVVRTYLHIQLYWCL